MAIKYRLSSNYILQNGDKILLIKYDEFIQNILNTRGRFACGDEYYERHHIVPRCLGGNNDESNLIDLYAREHFIAHKLLALENPEISMLQYAWWNMAHCKGDKQYRYECTPEEYEEARIAFSNNFKGESHPMYGKHHTDEAKKKISEAEKGENNPNYGKPMSDNAKRILSEKAKKRYKDKSNHPRYGCHLTEQTKEKMRKSLIGKMKGEKHPFFGRHYTMDEATKKKLSDVSPHKKRVAQYKEIDGEIVLLNIYSGINVAARAIGQYPNGSPSISHCCKGKGKTAYGFIWKYVDE